MPSRFEATAVIWGEVILVKDEPAFGGDTKYTFADFGDADYEYTVPLVYSIKSGELPPGMELDTATGGISGTPTSGGKFDSVIQVSDSSDPPVFPEAVGSVPEVEAVTVDGVTTTKITIVIQNNILNLVVNPGPELKDIKFVGPGGEPEWVSASLAEVPLIMELAKQARIAATLLQRNMQIAKTAAEVAKAFLLLQASTLSAILNAIADELEKLYNDLVNAGFYAIWIDGQEEFIQSGGGKVKVASTKAEMQTRYARAKAASNHNKILAKKAGLYKPADRPLPEQFPGNFAEEFLEWLANQYIDKEGTQKLGSRFPDSLPGTIYIEIDTDNYVPGELMLKAASGGVETNLIKQQTPNQFLAKLMMKLEDDNDPNTPYFSTSGQTGAFIFLVGIPDASELRNVAIIMDKIGSFVGAAVTGAWQIIKDLLKAAGIYDVDNPDKPDPEFKMTLYGVSGMYTKRRENEGDGGMFITADKQDRKEVPIYKPFNTTENNEVGEYLMGEDSGWAFKVSAAHKDKDYVDPLSGKKTRGDLGVVFTSLSEYADRKLPEGEKFIVDQTLMLQPTALGNSVEWFSQMYPKEKVRTAYKATEKLVEMDNNFVTYSLEMDTFKLANPHSQSQAQKGVWTHKKGEPMNSNTASMFDNSTTEYPEITIGLKNIPSPPKVVAPPAWKALTLAGTFEAYGEFLKYILIFAQFLRDLASGVSEQIDKIIKFIDEMIEMAEEIVAAILALLAFFEAIKDAGMYMLIIQDPDGSGLLKGGTDALIDAIGSATGQDATPQLDDDLNVIENPDLDLRRIKPPETLRYTMGFALVFGGPGAQEGFTNIAKLIKGEE